MSQTSASVLHFECLYTHDLVRKHKRWHDGQLRFHAFNSRVMVYDTDGTLVGDLHQRKGQGLEEGQRLDLDRGVLVEVGQQVKRVEQNLSEVVRQISSTIATGSRPSSTPTQRIFGGNNASAGDHAVKARPVRELVSRQADSRVNARPLKHLLSDYDHGRAGPSPRSESSTRFSASKLNPSTSNVSRPKAALIEPDSAAVPSRRRCQGLSNASATAIDAPENALGQVPSGRRQAAQKVLKSPKTQSKKQSYLRGPAALYSASATDLQQNAISNNHVSLVTEDVTGQGSKEDIGKEPSAETGQAIRDVARLRISGSKRRKLLSAFDSDMGSRDSNAGTAYRVTQRLDASAARYDEANPPQMQSVPHERPPPVEQLASVSRHRNEPNAGNASRSTRDITKLRLSRSSATEQGGPAKEQASAIGSPSPTLPPNVGEQDVLIDDLRTSRTGNLMEPGQDKDEQGEEPFAQAQAGGMAKDSRRLPTTKDQSRTGLDDNAETGPWSREAFDLFGCSREDVLQKKQGGQRTEPKAVAAV